MPGAQAGLQCESGPTVSLVTYLTSHGCHGYSLGNSYCTRDNYAPKLLLRCICTKIHLRGQLDFYLDLILLYEQSAFQRKINSVTYLTGYEIRTWICHVHVIGQKWNWHQSFQPLVMLLKLNDDKHYTGAEN